MASLWGITVQDCVSLPSYDDLNYKIVSSDNVRYVFKAFHLEETAAVMVRSAGLGCVVCLSFVFVRSCRRR